MLERRDPFSRMLSLRQMMDRLMEDAFVMPRDALINGLSAIGGGGGMDMYEEGDRLVVEAQLPGYKPEDVDVSVERGTLTIRGESRTQEERKDRTYIIREQRSGTFQRSVELPPTVNADACQASFEHGVLRLTFPKAEQAKPRRIQIATGGSGGTPSMGSSQDMTSGQGTGTSDGHDAGGVLGSASASQGGTMPGRSASGTALSTGASRTSSSSAAAMGGAAGEDATPPGTGPGSSGGSGGGSGDGPSSDSPSGVSSGGQGGADSDASTDPSKR